MAERKSPLRELLRKDNEWTCGRLQQEALEEIKRTLNSEPVLATYDGNKPIRISADASSFGLGVTTPWRLNGSQYCTFQEVFPQQNIKWSLAKCIGLWKVFLLMS